MCPSTSSVIKTRVGRGHVNLHPYSCGRESWLCSRANDRKTKPFIRALQLKQHFHTRLRLPEPSGIFDWELVIKHQYTDGGDWYNIRKINIVIYTSRFQCLYFWNGGYTASTVSMSFRGKPQCLCWTDMEGGGRNTLPVYLLLVTAPVSAVNDCWNNAAVVPHRLRDELLVKI